MDGPNNALQLGWGFPCAPHLYGLFPLIRRPVKPLKSSYGTGCKQQIQDVVFCPVASGAIRLLETDLWSGDEQGDVKTK